jgi:hypothetical protein
VAHQQLTALAPAVGVRVPPPPSLGHVSVTANQTQTITVPLLPSPATEATPVTVFSSNPAVVAVLAPGVIPVGSQTVTLSLSTGQSGVAILTLRAGSVVRQLTVIVGLPAAGVPLTAMALAVGVTVTLPPTLGHVSVTANQTQTITVPLLPSPAAGATPVTVFSSNPAVVAVLGPGAIPAGGQAVTLTLTTKQTGVAILTLRAGSVVRQLTVIVSLPVAGGPLTVVAPIVGVIVEE